MPLDLLDKRFTKMKWIKAKPGRSEKSGLSQYPKKNWKTDGRLQANETPFQDNRDSSGWVSSIEAVQLTNCFRLQTRQDSRLYIRN